MDCAERFTGRNGMGSDAQAPTAVPAVPAERRLGELRAVIEEFGRVLDSFGSQLDAAVTDADRECAGIGVAFNELGAAKRGLDAIDCPEPARTLMRRHSSDLGAALDAAVTAMQYQDRLTQRVGHIRVGLHRLQTSLRDGIDRNTGQWLSLLRHVEAENQAEQERLAAAENACNGRVELF